MGAGFEDSYAYSTHNVATSELGTKAIKEFKWEAVGNDINVNFLVKQIGTNIYFYDMAGTAVSDGLKSFTVNMSALFAPNVSVTEAALCELSFASGKGSLFIVGEKYEPALVSYDAATDTIEIKRIYIQIRDFQGLKDGLANDEEPTTLSAAHNYNLMNQGWVNPENDGTGLTHQYFGPFGEVDVTVGPSQLPITQYFAHANRYPGNNKQWWVAKKAADNKFDPVLLQTFYFGSGRAPRGHFVVNAFFKDYSAVSGISGLVAQQTSQRPTSTAFATGRVWYACQSTVYYSQILSDTSKAGLCYQEADPTSEDISDLVATDGGAIEIPEMGKALRLVPAAGGVLVFANNGIWFVGGAGGGFSALDLTVQKVSGIGTESPNSIVDGREGIFWFSRVGIQGMEVQSGAAGNSFQITTISEQTIQSYYVDIPKESIPYVKSVYDPATNVIQWLWNSSPTGTHYHYDRILNLDLTLTAFFPFSLSSTGPQICGVFLTPYLNDTGSPYNSSLKPTFIKYAVSVPQGSVNKFTFGFFRDYTFADWKDYDGVGYNYLSYIESGYELLEDAMRNKSATYVFCYFRRTEENYVASGEDYEADNPSSCLFQVKWDWASSQVGNKYSTKVEAYRHVRLPMFDEDNLEFDTGFPIVISKNKVRGNGRAIQFRFESNGIGKDFDLLGWSVPYSGGTAP